MSIKELAERGWKELLAVWRLIPEDTRREIVSLSHTFGSTLFLAIMAEAQMGNIELKWSTLFAVGATALRAAWKATVNALITWLKSREK